MKNLSIRSWLICFVCLLSSCAQTPPLDGFDIKENLYSLEIDRIMSHPLISDEIFTEKDNEESLSDEILDPDQVYTCSHPPAEDNITKKTNFSIEFIEADLREALLELSLLTGISIITDENIEGLISANFQDIALESALTVMLSAGNYGFKKHPNYIFVGSKDPNAAAYHLLSTTCIYKPSYLSPESIVELLPPYYRQYVNYSESGKHISIVAAEDIQKRIQKDILQFDRAPKQVRLEVSIIEVSTEALDILGLNWRHQNSSQQYSAKYIFDGSGLPIKTVFSRRLFESINFLKTKGMAYIKAMPTILTLDGKKAEFKSTHTVWGLGLKQARKSKRDTLTYGVTITVVPHISNTNQILLDISDASVSDLTMQSDGSPKLISHSISNSVRVSDGRALILGGLLQRKYKPSNTSVPGISDVHVLGWMFKQERKESLETEVLIVIQPQIIH